MKKEITKGFIRQQIEIEFHDVFAINNSDQQNQKIDKWKKHIEIGYDKYKRLFNEAKLSDKVPLSIDKFASEVLTLHHKKYTSTFDINRKKSYHTDTNYFNTIIEDYINESLIRQQDNHLFNPTNTNPLIMNLQNLIHLYQNQMSKIEVPTKSKDKLVLQLSRRSLEQIKTGIILISYNLFNDSFIVWRSFFEVLVYLKNIENADENAANKFYERKESAKEFNRLKKTTSVGLESRIEELNNRVSKKNKVDYWEKERYSWILGGKDTFTLRTLAKKVNLEKKYPYYSIASLFTHEYLLNESDFEVISIENLIITLYWQLFEDLRNILIKNYKDLFDIKEIKQPEEKIRKMIATDKGPFTDFTNNISKFTPNF